MKSKSADLIKAIADGTAGKPDILITVFNQGNLDGGMTSLVKIFTDSDIWADGFKIEKATSSDNSFDIGGAIVGKLTFVINKSYTHDDYTQSLDYYGKKCEPTLMYYVNDRYYPIKMGSYTIVDIKYNTTTTTFTAYDDLYLFDKPYTDSTLTFPATLQEIVADACRCCNVKWNGKAFTHDDYVINSKPEKVTFREMLAYIGQMTCHFARMTEDGFLEFGWYQNTDDHRWDQKSSYSRVAAMQPVTITGTRLIYKAKSKDSTEMETEVSSGTTGYMITIQNNPLIDLCGTSPQLICDNLLADLKKTPAFLPGKMDIPANPLIDCGDIIGYWSESKHAYLYDTLVTGISYSPSEKTEIRCGGDSATRINATQYDVSTKNDLYTYDLLKANRAYEQSEREKAIADLTEKISNSSGLFTTKQTDSSGATIYYMHDLPELSESKIIWKMTSEAVAVSTDGGKTYNAGITVNGDVIARILNATGVNADWIRTGTLSADLIKTGSLSADLIKSGRLDAKFIGSGDIMLSDDLLRFFTSTGGRCFAAIGKNRSAFERLYISPGAVDDFNGDPMSWVRMGIYTNSNGIAQNPFIILNSKYNKSRTRIYDSQISIESAEWESNNSVTIGMTSRLYCDNLSLNSTKVSGRGYFNVDCSSDIDTNLELSGNSTYYLKFYRYQSLQQSALVTNADIRFLGDFAEIAGAKIDMNNLAINNIKVDNSLKVNGTKSRVADTADYGDRLLYCYETPTPYFGDIGEGEIADDGNCYVFIDPVFSETITTAQYQVFLQAYGDGKLYVKERKSNYFIVAGTPHLQFGWELKAKQKGFDQLRIKKDVGDDDIQPEKAKYGDLAAAHLASITNSYKNAQPADTTAKTAN